MLFQSAPQVRIVGSSSSKTPKGVKSAPDTAKGESLESDSGKKDRYGNDVKYWVDFTTMTEWSQDGLKRYEVRRMEVLNASV